MKKANDILNDCPELRQMPYSVPEGYFEQIHEQYISSESNYVIGDIRLSELIAKREQLRAKDLFIANIPIFFLNQDN